MTLKEKLQEEQQNNKLNLNIIISIFVLVFIDLFTKYFIYSNGKENYHYILNQGVFFGFLRKRQFLVLMFQGLVFFITLFTLQKEIHKKKKNYLNIFCSLLFLTGIFGNFFGRISLFIIEGKNRNFFSVIDFINITFPKFIFFLKNKSGKYNIADLYGFLSFVILFIVSLEKIIDFVIKKVVIFFFKNKQKQNKNNFYVKNKN